jgi:multisubunit Na+/H+ antiporter MnhB subunit
MSDTQLKHLEAHSDSSVMHLRGGRSVRKSSVLGEAQPAQDDSMKNVQTFMYLVAGLCGIFLVGAFMKDVSHWRLTCFHRYLGLG